MVRKPCKPDPVPPPADAGPGGPTGETAGDASPKGRRGGDRGGGRPRKSDQEKLVQITVTVRPETFAAIEDRRQGRGFTRGQVVDLAVRALLREDRTVGEALRDKP